MARRRRFQMTMPEPLPVIDGTPACATTEGRRAFDATVDTPRTMGARDKAEEAYSQRWCSRCPLRRPCAAVARLLRPSDGVWGGHPARDYSVESGTKSLAG